MQTSYMQAYLDGRQAFLDGEDFFECPYVGILFDRWVSGYNAETEMH